MSPRSGGSFIQWPLGLARRIGALLVLVELLAAAPAPALTLTGKFVCCEAGPGCEPVDPGIIFCGGIELGVGYQAENRITLTFDPAGGPVTGSASLHSFTTFQPDKQNIDSAELSGTYTYDPEDRRGSFTGTAKVHRITLGYSFGCFGGTSCGDKCCAYDSVESWGASFEGTYIASIIPGIGPFLISALPPPTPTPTPEVDYIADALEVVQSVQNLNSQVRFVANKRTFVRLYGRVVRPAGVLPPGNGPDTATLEVERDGETETVKPINPGGGIRLKEIGLARRTVLNDAFLFELPLSFLDGAVKLTGRIAPGPWETKLSNNVRVENVIFETVPPMDLKLYAVQNADAPVPQPDFDPLVEWLGAAYPVHWVRDERRRLEVATGINEDAEELALLLNGKRLWNRTFNNEPKTVRYYAVYLHPAPVPDIFGSITIGFGIGGAAAGLNDSPELGAHELGHTYGGCHPHLVCGAWNPLCGFPIAGGSISLNHPPDLPSAMVGFDKRSKDLYPAYSDFFPNDSYWDIMTYCTLRWLSDYHYHVFMNTLRSEGGVSGAARDARDRLLVLGLAAASTGQVRIAPLFTLPNVPEPTTPVPGDYAIVLRNAQGTELSRHRFTPEEVHIDPPPDATGQVASPVLSFAELVPFVAGTDRVDLEGPTGVLHSVTAGSQVPSVTVVTPNGGEVLSSDPLVVTWTAHDADGDPLTFNVQYSADDGATWSLVAQSVVDNQVAIDRVNLAGSERAKVRVWVSDGVHSSYDESDAPFAVPNLAPTAEIVEPAEDVTVAAGQTVGFEGKVYDTDEGSLPPERITWESDHDGVLGHGAAMPVASLSVGTHRVTLRADDGDGGVTTDSVRVVVVRDIDELPPLPDALVVTPERIHLNPALGLHRDAISIDNANLPNRIGWEASADASWLLLSETSGTTPAAVWLSVNTGGLSAGTYSATVTVTSPDLPGARKTTRVTLQVPLAAGTGDCNGDRVVTIDELIHGVNIALGNLPLSACPVFDANGNGQVTIDELITAVRNALYGLPTPVPSRTRTGSPVAPTSSPVDRPY